MLPVSSAYIYIKNSLYLSEPPLQRGVVNQKKNYKSQSNISQNTALSLRYFSVCRTKYAFPVEMG